jgi:recombinational DNA repair protein (RecF pathway)
LSEVRATFYGRQGTELYRLGGCELLRSAFLAGSRGLQNALAFSYFAELLDAFCPELQKDDDVYRLAVSVIRAAEDGRPAEQLSRYLEAWLLRLHGIYPPLDRCAACHHPLPPGDLRYHTPARGFVCGCSGPVTGPSLPAAVRGFLGEVFRHAPAAVARTVPGGAALEAFHHSLISSHLERDLRSHRVLRDVARETSG